MLGIGHGKALRGPGSGGLLARGLGEHGFEHFHDGALLGLGESGEKILQPFYVKEALSRSGLSLTANPSNFFYFIGILATTVGGFFTAIKIGLIKQYQLDRILVFLKPDIQKEGIG